MTIQEYARREAERQSASMTRFNLQVGPSHEGFRAMMRRPEQKRAAELIGKILAGDEISKSKREGL